MAFDRLNRQMGLILAGLMIGCASGPRSSSDAPKVTLVSDSRVTLDSTVVQVDRGSIDISGNVHRRSGVGQLSGRIDIEFLGPSGDLLDALPALIVPHDLTTAKPSTYHTTYAFIPPKGSTLRIHFVDSDTETREDLEGGFLDNGGHGGNGGVAGTGGGGAVNGAANGPGNRHAAGANHYVGHSTGFGSDFGTNNFAPGGRR